MKKHVIGTAFFLFFLICLLAGQAFSSWIGVTIQDWKSNAGDRTGARILSVEPGGPAALAGLRADDIIFSVNGQPLRGAKDLIEMLKRVPARSLVVLQVQRAGRIAQLRLATSDPPPGRAAQHPPGTAATVVQGAGMLRQVPYALSPDQVAVVDETGWPETFKITIYAEQEGSEDTIRDEVWNYHSKGKSFSFRNGVLIVRRTLDPVRGHLVYAPYKPVLFRAGMTPEEVFSCLETDELIKWDLPEERMEMYWVKQLVLGFIDQGLVFVETRPDDPRRKP
ncbi:MAG: putative periplasmic serine endoprotease DegP-like precursor [Syntrophaceae bacterium PtaU1.Bin231]|nr:MAG: putative periplasmic serine endoprotease DegP-like precursor [Syntrophaceae bacterium PtaU1.Bin231]